MWRYSTWQTAHRAYTSAVGAAVRVQYPRYSTCGGEGRRWQRGRAAGTAQGGATRTTKRVGFFRCRGFFDFGPWLASSPDGMMSLSDVAGAGATRSSSVPAGRARRGRRHGACERRLRSERVRARPRAATPASYSNCSAPRARAAPCVRACVARVGGCGSVRERVGVREQAGPCHAESATAV